MRYLIAFMIKSTYICRFFSYSIFSSLLLSCSFFIFAASNSSTLLYRSFSICSASIYACRYRSIWASLSCSAIRSCSILITLCYSIRSRSNLSSSSYLSLSSSNFYNLSCSILRASIRSLSTLSRSSLYLLSSSSFNLASASSFSFYAIIYLFKSISCIFLCFSSISACIWAISRSYSNIAFSPGLI